MFGSRIKKQFKPYVSWHADPEAFAVDAFSLNWNDFNFVYLFPPFSLLGKVVFKLQQDRARAILIAPKWLTQTWYPRLLQLVSGTPLQLPRRKTLLRLPSQPGVQHPLAPKLQPMAYYLSGLN